MRSSEIAIIALVTASLAAGGVFAFVASPPSSPCSGVTGAIRSFSIIANLNGYNGSISQAAPWPVVTVQRCDTVEFTVHNTDTQTHGFAVTSYSNAGLELVGGDTQTLSFQATRTGHFTIYCNTLHCSVHWAMQYGLLTVT